MKTAIVTGASSGIGLAITKMLLKKKFRVIVLGRDFSKTKIRNRNFEQVVCDLTQTKEVELWAKSVVKSKTPVDVLVNNANISHDGVSPTMPLEQMRQTLEVNLRAALVLAKECTAYAG